MRIYPDSWAHYRSDRIRIYTGPPLWGRILMAAFVWIFGAVWFSGLFALALQLRRESLAAAAFAGLLSAIGLGLLGLGLWVLYGMGHVVHLNLSARTFHKIGHRLFRKASVYTQSLDSSRAVRLEPCEATFGRGSDRVTLRYWRVCIELSSDTELARFRNYLPARRLAEAVARGLGVGYVEGSMRRLPEDLNTPLVELMRQGKVPLAGRLPPRPPKVFENESAEQLLIRWRESSPLVAVVGLIGGLALGLAFGGIRAVAETLRGYPAAMLTLPVLLFLSGLAVAVWAWFRVITIIVGGDAIRVRSALFGMGWFRTIPLRELEGLYVVPPTSGGLFHELQFVSDRCVWTWRSTQPEVLGWVERRLLLRFAGRHQAPTSDP